MKVKKLLALVLSALMAVTMLTACGGGSGGGSSKKLVDLDKINRQVKASVSDMTVEELPELEKGLAAVEAMIATKNMADIQFSDVSSLIYANINAVPRSYSSVANKFNFSGDVNTILADLVIANEAKSSARVFYVGAVNAKTKDGQSYLVYVTLT